MKITAACALGLALTGLGRCFNSHPEYPRTYLSAGQLWIQRSASEAPFQATHDCVDKGSPAVSLDRKRIAYAVTCAGNDRLVSSMSLVVLDGSGKEVARFAPLPMKKFKSNCTQAEDLQWVDDYRIAMTCPYNPSLEDYLVVNARTGEVETEYPGLWFARSPDRKTVAHVGFLMHFAPPMAQNFCLFFNEKAIYTRDCSNDVLSDQSGFFRNIHTFDFPLVWSPDSRNIAFVEEVFDWSLDPAPNETDSGKSSNERYYLVIASADQPARGYSLRLSEYSKTSSLVWISTSQIKLDNKIYDLVKNQPEAIP